MRICVPAVVTMAILFALKTKNLAIGQFPSPKIKNLGLLLARALHGSLFLESICEIENSNLGSRAIA